MVRAVKKTFDEEVGERLRRKREGAKVLQRQAAARIKRNVTQICRYESGEYTAPTEVLQKLAEMYGTNISYFVTGKE